MEFDELSTRVIGGAIEVQRTLGPGLLESTYEQCMAHELSLARIPFAMQLAIPVEYKGLKLDCGYRIDLLVESKLILELKTSLSCCRFTKRSFLPTWNSPKFPSDC